MVPLFQRPYTWDESRWKVLWADLMELCEDEQGTELAKPHFLGSIVTVPTRSVPEGVTKFLLIDGQQRLTTLQVLLATLRDLSRELPGQLAERLDKSYLVNQFEDGLDHFKLLPTQTNGDRAAFLAVMKNEASADSASRVAKAYLWFQKKLKARNSPDAERLASVILRRLSLVSITLDHDDNPHLIFESLNYKGEPLTQGDLIRNYFLMRVPVPEQERLFHRYWEPMQLRLNEQLSEFVRHSLTRQGGIVKQGELFHSPLRVRCSDLRTEQDSCATVQPSEGTYFIKRRRSRVAGAAGLSIRFDVSPGTHQRPSLRNGGTSAQSQACAGVLGTCSGG